ncbi:GTP-binding protein [Pseudomonadales bacterium]|nr:GTP-binding protein [Pseudomonadales bacterium]MDG1938127.1 GTP-binding protein [Pseudomonadales bacterium]
MKKTTPKIQAVPTNIITGFLGAGKTSAILHLLKSKPHNERWAVLVNEFGEIGVDGSLFQGQDTEEGKIFIREVPGGCMCCTAGLPMQIALNQLLTRAKPDRLLIEPTGLGHPVEVLESLTNEHYFDVLSIEKIITLVDARNLADSRYTDHATFNQQIAIADIVVGNKQDLYQPEDKGQLERYAKAKALSEVEVIFTEQGQLALNSLQGPTAASVSTNKHSHAESVESAEKKGLADIPLPESGYLTAINQGEGFHSIGWRFDASKIFNKNALFLFLSGIVAERMKAVFITDKGICGYNLTSDSLTEIALDECIESRIEIIASDIRDQWEGQLLACIKEANE